MVEPDTHSHLDCDVSPGEETRIIVITSTLPFNYFVSTDNLQEKSETPENLVISERADHVAINFARNVPSKYQVIFVGKLIHENSNFASQDKKDLLKNMMERQKSCLVVGHVGPDKEQSFGRSRLWPLFHNVLWESSLDQNTRLSEWLKYESENLAFSDVVRKHWRPNDIVVIFDFALLLLPAMLRAHCESTSIGLYLRTPFPSSELFRCLPEAKKILSGALGANVIGLQTHGYVRHLISSCTRLLGLESTPKRVDFNGTPVDIVAQPIGIDPGVIRANLKSEAVWKRIEILGEKYMPMGYHSMRDKHLVRDMNVDMQRVAADEKLNFDTEGTRLILGMESVDQCNGILHKLATLNNLFQRYPEWIGRVSQFSFIFILNL